MRLLTIGGYGFTREAFISALVGAKVDTLVDIRQRRGVRGSKYSFLNHRKLEAAVEGAGLRYVYVRELAPTSAIRAVQKAQDEATGELKRTRQELAPEFARAYHEEILSHYTKEMFLAAVGQGAQAVALFCVEGPPAACHRSLAAAFLGELLQSRAEHLLP